MEIGAGAGIRRRRMTHGGDCIMFLSSSAAGSSTMVMVIYLVVIVAFFYFFFIRPQNKEKKQKDALLSSVAVGDSVLTTAGVYGVIVDMNDDTVIVEFGNNKNCRIPMQKAAIVQVEKPEDAIAEDESKTK